MVSRENIKVITRVSSVIWSFFIFSVSVTPATCLICLLGFQILCHSYVKDVPHWLPTILVILANDIHLNPGPHYQTDFLNFISWNLNSITKDNFESIRLIESHNSIFNYGLISICETSLNEFQSFLLNFEHLYSRIKAENPLAMFFTGDFNAHCQFWWY